VAVDAGELSRALGIPVIPMVAATGEGVEDLVKACVKAANDGHETRPPLLRYGEDVERHIHEVAGEIDRASNGKPLPSAQDRPYGLSSRALAVQLLEQDREFMDEVAGLPRGPEILSRARDASREIETRHGEKADLRLARERHGLAGELAGQVETREHVRSLLSSRLYQATLRPWTGIPIMVGVLVAVFGLMYYVGGFLSAAFGNVWSAWVSPGITWTFSQVLGAGLLTRFLLWGFNAGFQAALSVGIPFVIPFYFLLAAIEDSGYLASIAYLADSLMHRLGLHGRSLISLVAGLGCNVPAIIGTRVLTTMRERVIASTLISLTTCSARTAVIMGAVALFVGLPQALAVYGIVLLVNAGVGLGMQRLMPGRSAGLVMEMFPFRSPRLR
jgi:ferrous iron transport protein B